jgi:hypothetical protein
VVNFLDALTDHGGYFKNDEEVLRRVAAEIDADVYQQSLFWKPPDGQVADAVPRRRSRVAWLGFARIVGVAVAIAAALVFADSIAGYVAGIGPVAAALSGAREVQRLLEELPVVGQGLAQAWRFVVEVALLVLGAAIASLLGLVPFEVFRALWDWNDSNARDALLHEKATRPTDPPGAMAQADDTRRPVRT